MKLSSTHFTYFDENRLESLLKRDYVDFDPLLKNELEFLNEIRMKTGIQDLNESLTDYIQKKVHPFLIDHHQPADNDQIINQQNIDDEFLLL